MDRDRERDRGAPRRPEEPVEGRARTPEPTIDEPPRRQSAEDLAQEAGRSNWGPGVLAAFLTFLLLELLVFGLGLVAATDRPGDAGSEDVVTGIVGLIAFFVGGYVASMTSGARDERAGLLDGVLVWAFVTILLLLFSSLGVGQFFGALGDVVGQSRALGDPTTTIDPSQISNTIQSSALGAFLSLLVWALASAAGGWLGARSGLTIGRTGGVRRLG
jgi:hypothetical protein